MAVLCWPCRLSVESSPSSHHSNKNTANSVFGPWLERTELRRASPAHAIGVRCRLALLSERSCVERAPTPAAFDFDLAVALDSVAPRLLSTCLPLQQIKIKGSGR